MQIQVGASAHIVAFAAASLLVFGLGVQQYELPESLAPIDTSWYKDFTPYFPGMDKLETHEIFSPLYKNTKKIVLLGASAVDSVGCDETWGKPDPTRNPDRNVDASCTIAAQMNNQLSAANIRNWRVFNLARNGAKLTSMLYVYTHLLALRPEIIIYGDTTGYYNGILAGYYSAENADANSLNAAQYEYMSKIFDRSPEWSQLWRTYLATLQQHGWTPPRPSPQNASIQNDTPQQSYSVEAVLIRGFSLLRMQRFAGPPLPIKMGTARWNARPFLHQEFHNPDIGFGYFRGMLLIAKVQKQFGGRFLFYLSPVYGYRNERDYVDGMRHTFGAFLASAGGVFMSHLDLELKTDVETYDGVHQTLYGNKKVAAALVDDLVKNDLLK